MTFNNQLENAVATIVDTCVFYEGNCDNCELKTFCEASKPIEIVK